MNTKGWGGSKISKKITTWFMDDPLGAIHKQSSQIFQNFIPLFTQIDKCGFWQTPPKLDRHFQFPPPCFQKLEYFQRLWIYIFYCVYMFLLTPSSMYLDKCSLCMAPNLIDYCRPLTQCPVQFQEKYGRNTTTNNFCE